MKKFLPNKTKQRFGSNTIKNKGHVESSDIVLHPSYVCMQKAKYSNNRKCFHITNNSTGSSHNTSDIKSNSLFTSGTFVSNT